MTSQDYIQSKLDDLRTPTGVAQPSNDAQLIDTIVRLVMSKKFRKYAASPELAEHIKAAVRINVEKREPINFTLQHGAFKLWRLDESPDVDWAEVFTHAYYTKWVKPICEIYEPGVWFDFYVHDQIIPILNNIPVSDTHTYLKGYRMVMDFMKQYQPKNLNMTITLVSSLFPSAEAFEQELERKRVERAGTFTGGEIPDIADSEMKVVDLNVKVTDEQQKDPKWREKVWYLHDAYLSIQDDLGYREGRREKILVSTLPVPEGNTIAVGTTKHSIMKFWLGTGALKKEGEGYHQVVYSPSQLEKTKCAWEAVHISGLEGRNLSKIRICNPIS